MAIFALGASGCFGFGKSDDATDPVLLSSTPPSKVTAPSAAPDYTSTLARSTAEVLAMRLGKLFPSTTVADDVIKTATIAAPLGRPDFVTSSSTTRQTSALAQSALRKKVAALCKGSTTIFSTSGILMPGEQLPSNAATLKAFAAARNGWLYPYEADSEEVQKLATFYSAALADGTPTQATQELCMAVLLSPPFWLGTPGPREIIRRMALEIGGRPPTFEEFGKHASGELTPEAFARALQREPGYIANVKGWHRDWLGTQDIYRKYAEKDPVGYYVMDPRNPYIVSRGGAGGVGGTHYLILMQAIDGVSRPTLNLSWNDGQTFYGAVECDNMHEQAFDPSVTQLKWDTRAAPTDPWVESSNLSTITPVPTPAPNPAWDINSLRRIRRYSQSGLQNGFSKVKLWWNGEEVYVCNGITRYVASCAYRPSPSDSNVRLETTYYASGLAGWTANEGRMYGGSWGIYWPTVAHPSILANFNCGKMDTAALETAAAPPYNQNASSDLNPWVINAGTISHYYRTAGEAAALAGLYQSMSNEPLNLVGEIVAGNGDYRELLTANYTYVNGPLDLLYRSQDYYLPALPPGSYTKPGEAGYQIDGSAYHKLDAASIADIPESWMRNTFHSSYAFLFPGMHNPYRKLTPKPMAGVLTQPAFAGFSGEKLRAYSARIFRTFTCGELTGNAPTDSGGIALHEGKVFSNDQNGNAHLDKVRGCYQCHINIDPMAAAMSRGFMQAGYAGDGLLTFGAAVTAMDMPPESRKITETSILKAGGEMMPHATGNQAMEPLLGIRGSSASTDIADGAVFGQPAHGIRGVAQALANSQPFAACAVQRAYESLVGRPATYNDAKMLKNVTALFKHNYNYNDMIVELVKSAQYQKGN